MQGEKSVESLLVENTVTGAVETLEVTGLFVAIGHDPRSGLVAGQVTVDYSQWGEDLDIAAPKAKSSPKASAQTPKAARARTSAGRVTGRPPGRGPEGYRGAMLFAFSIAPATAPDPAWLAVYRALIALRIQVNRLQDLGAYTTESVRADIDGHLRNAFASWASGPPVQRVRQLLST